MHLRTLILIARLAFIGLPVSVNAAAAPSAEQKQGGGEKPSTKINAQPQNPSSPVVVQPKAPQPTDRYSYQIENYNYNSNKEWDWPTAAQALSAIALVAFAAWQMHFITRTTKATETAANAAQKTLRQLKKLSNLSRRKPRLLPTKPRRPKKALRLPPKMFLPLKNWLILERPWLMFAPSDPNNGTDFSMWPLPRDI
jgi:hypothetical protein